jgi:hypothetical protein
MYQKRNRIPEYFNYSITPWGTPLLARNVWSVFETKLEPTMSSKEPKLSDDQDQYHNESINTDSLQPTQDVLMTSGEAGPSPSQPPHDHMAAPTTANASQISAFKFIDILDSAISVQEEDLAALNTLFEEPGFQANLGMQHFGVAMAIFQEHFEKHPDLLSRLEIPLGNLHRTHSKYTETRSSQMLQSALFDALSQVAEDPNVQNWNAVFSHRNAQPY